MERSYEGQKRPMEHGLQVAIPRLVWSRKWRLVWSRKWRQTGETNSSQELHRKAFQRRSSRTLSRSEKWQNKEQ